MKAKIEQFIHSWGICVEDAGNLKLELAVAFILRSIKSELQKGKARLSESEFQDLIHFALQKAQALPRNLRFETFSYLNGGIQREVQRPEYHELKQCIIKHLRLIPWPSYGVSIATEVILAILLILIVASMPGLALATKRSRSASPENAAPPCTHLLKIDYAKSNLMLQDIKLQLSQMGIDYNKLPMQADISVEKIRRHADCFAHTLTQFCADKLNPLAEEKLLHTVSNDDAYMEPLYLILTYAQNEALRCKIIAKLSLVLYMDIHSARAFNSGRLIRILGQAIMAIHPDKLPPGITKDAIVRMSDILSLYRRIAQSESMVNKQSLALRALLETERSITPQPMPVEENFYYAQFLVPFIVMLGLVQIFMRFLNRTFSTPKVNNKKTTMPEQTNVLQIPLSSKPLATKSSHQITPPQIAVKKISIPENLQTILAKLNELFEDLIIPNPYSLRWSEFKKALACLELEAEKYCFNTKGDGKIFWLSKTALNVLVKKYCKEHLGAEEQSIGFNVEWLVLKQPFILKFNDNSRAIKQYYAAFFKILRQLANVYYPMDIQLDYHLGEFSVVFSLNKEARYEIESLSLTMKQFLHCVHSSLNLNGQEMQFSIAYKIIKDMSLPNEKEFLAMKKEACTIKRNEFTRLPGFFNQNEASNDSQKNISITPLKTLKNR